MMVKNIIIDNELYIYVDRFFYLISLFWLNLKYVI